MMNMLPFNIIFVILVSLCQTSYALDSQWVNEDDSQNPSEELPVLHTAFVQTGEELHYFSESTRYESDLFVGHRVYQDQASKTSCKDRKYHVRRLAGEDSMSLEFDPPYLDFGNKAVGVPTVRRVSVRSRLNKAVILDSIVGDSINIHSSFFDTYELPPFGQTFFDVAFLPREEMRVSASLNIHTSAGIFLYEVSGNADSNPYRISPAVGDRLPFNATISKDITLHNPYEYTLRIKEVMSSGGSVHAEMFHGVDSKYGAETPQYWNILPYQTKTVARVHIVGHYIENVTAFVRVSGELLNESTENNQRKQCEVVLALPIEVTKKGGVFTTTDILDFGLLKQGERSAAKTFTVYQYQLPSKLEFETLYVEKGDATGIYMEFASNPPISVHPGKSTTEAGKPVDLVKVFFDASRITFDGASPAHKTFTGRIIAVSRGGNYNVTIPFRAAVYQGDISVVENDLAVQQDLRPPHRRSVRLRNELPFPVSIWNVSISPDAAEFFTVRLFERRTDLGRGEERSVFLLKYNKRVPDVFGSAVVYIHTNISTFRTQLWKYAGRIQVELSSIEQDRFNFGMLERNDTRVIRFTIHNNNRAAVTIRGLKVPDVGIYRLFLVSIRPNKLRGHQMAVLGSVRREWVQGTDLEISPESSAVMELELRAPANDLLPAKDFLISTEYESKVFPIIYSISSGTLAAIPDTLSFGYGHPGKMSYRNLQVFNSFSEDMSLTRLSTLSRDPRFHFEGFDRKKPPVLRSGRLTNLGRVLFMPKTPCVGEHCYLGLPLHTTDGQWFVHGLTLPANLAEVDNYLYKKQRARFDNLVKSGGQFINTTVVVDTDKARNIQIPASSELVWPRLLTRNSIHFPLTAVGNFSIINLTLANPTAVPIVVQVIPLVIYPDADSVVDFFKEHLLTPLTSEVEMNETLMFSLRDTELFTLKSDSPVPRLREELEGAVPQTVPRFTLSLLLKPHMKVRLRLGFLPSDYTLRSSLLLIRNNLTIIEPVVVYGRGARIGMSVEGVQARTKEPLLFEIRHDHLTDCNNPKRLMHKLSSTLTVRRPFTVSNTGEVPFTVVNMSINGVPCENRGFRILNCYPFKLMPNETYSLDLAFTPDFLTTTNEADLQLYMHMNGSSWLFPLAATVPADMMSRCHRALPRPPFEGLMYYSCVTALLFCLICVLACAYLEGDRAIACGIREHYTATRTVFDLNNLNSVKKSSTNRSDSWRDQLSVPCGLVASADAGRASRAFYRAANQAVKLVHFVWRWSLPYRNQEDQPKPNSKKKKKPQVPVVNCERTEVPKRDASVSQLGQTKETRKTISIAPSSTGKKVQQVRPSTKPSTTNVPSPPTDEKKIRKLSNGKPAKPREEAVLARVESNMDNFDADTLSRGRSASVRRRAVPVKQEEPISVAVGKNLDAREEVVSYSGRATSRPVSIPSSEAGDHFNLADLDDLSPDLNRPLTPTPSLASTFSNDHARGSCFPNGSVSSRDASLTRHSAAAFRQQQFSDDELSVTSETSTAPDWMNEAIDISNVDPDFSAMAAATERLLGSESENGEDQLGMGRDRVRKRTARTGRPEHSQQNATAHTATWPDVPVPVLPSLAPGTDWLSSQQWVPVDESPAQLNQWSSIPSDTYNPLSLGLSLGPSIVHGSLFSGQDFNPWAESSALLDGASSWANIGEEDRSNEQKK